MREDAAGLEAADIPGHRLGGDVEQGVAGEVAAFGRQILDGVRGVAALVSPGQAG